MKSLESVYKQKLHSQKSILGAAAVTALVFGSIVTTEFSIPSRNESLADTVPIYYMPPPAPPSYEKEPQPASSASTKTVAFDYSFKEQPAEIALSFVDVKLEATPGVGMDLVLDVGRKFVATRPNVDSIDQVVVYERGQVDERPRRTYAPKPDVPYSLGYYTAELIVLYIVNKKGRAENIHILSSSNTEFNDIARESVGRWRFKPAIRSGEAVNSWVQHEFNFDRGSTSPFSLN